MAGRRRRPRCPHAGVVAPDVRPELLRDPRLLRTAVATTAHDTGITFIPSVLGRPHLAVVHAPGRVLAQPEAELRLGSFQFPPG